ncbi:hypothetical protein [Micromonospora sp. SD19]
MVEHAAADDDWTRYNPGRIAPVNAAPGWTADARQGSSLNPASATVRPTPSVAGLVASVVDWVVALAAARRVSDHASGFIVGAAGGADKSPAATHTWVTTALPSLPTYSRPACPADELSVVRQRLEAFAADVVTRWCGRISG